MDQATIYPNPSEKQDAWREALNRMHPESAASMPGNSDDAVQFLRWLDPTGWFSLSRINPETGNIEGRTFAPGSWDAIAAFVEKWNGRENLYFSANEPFPGTPDKKLSENDIAFVRALCADQDPELDVPFERARFDLDQIAERVQSNKFAPSATIDSGGGNQYFWKLREKFDVVAGGKERARAQSRALKMLFGNDNVQSIDHLFRLPGTINLPNKKKRAAGRTARPAKILFTTDHRYTIEDFETGIAQVDPSGKSEVDTDPFVRDAIAEIDIDAARTISSYDDLSEGLRERFDKACRSSERLVGLWNGDERYLRGDKSGSGWRLCLAIELGRSIMKFTAQNYVELVCAWPHVTNSHDYDPRQYARDWGKFAAPAIAERETLIERFFEPWSAETSPGWPDPVDIFGDADPMDLGEPPAQSLPSSIERFARSEARRKGVSMAFAAAAAVGVTAAAIGASLRIQVRQHDTDWTEPASLWLALVAEPGRAKSPTISEATRPLRDLDGEHYRACKAQHEIWAAQVQAHKKQKGAPAPGREPAIRRVTVDDVTFEMQARIHADNPRGLLRTPDELMGFFGSFGAYKQKGDGDRTQMLRLFDGGSIMMDRVGAGSIRADHALMGIVAGTQPEKIEKIARDLGADGMLQRFLFVLDDGAERRGLDEAPDARAAQTYRTMLRSLATADYGFTNKVRMGSDAQAVFNETMGNIDGLKGLVGMPVAWRGHVEKWGKIFPRIVLTFHCIDQFSIFGQVDPTMAIDPMSVEFAANFARFLLRHSLTFYRQSFDLDPVDEEARAFAGYLLTRPDMSSVSHRTLYDARTSLRGDEKKRTRNRIFKELEAAGWLRTSEQGANGPVRCGVNPAVHDRFKDRAEWERRDRDAKRAAIQKSGEAKKWIETDSVSGKSEAIR